MPVAHPHQQPRLADHVRACLCSDQLIFLDLLRGKYIGVGGPRLHALSEFILGSPPTASCNTSSSNPAIVQDWINALIHQGLLSEAPSLRNPKRPKLLDPVASLDAEDEDKDEGHDHQDWPQLPPLWRSTWVSSMWLRRLSLGGIEERVVALRARFSNRDRSLDASAMRAAASTYMRLRHFALSSHDRCLNDSLALVHFLAGQGLFPQWVIGVRVHPFCAHSWVQYAGVVLNDQPEHVRSYQPILIV